MSNQTQAPISHYRSIMDMKCPRCRTGSLFFTSTLSFQKPFDMPDRCSHCGLNYNPEPGFFYGAMFISYAIWGWFSIFFCLTLVFYFGWSVNATFALLIGISALFFVWLFRISRSLWIHFNIKFDASKA
jgi:uncharacterized protein (DUF983 family)